MLAAPQGFPKGAVVAAVLVALIGIWIFAIAHASSTILASEDFSQNAANFTTVAGGTWATKAGHYDLSGPAATSDPDTGNANYAINKATLTGNFTEEVDYAVVPTSSGFDDAAVIFNWADPSDYMYASFNETANATTNGIFAISGGVQTRLVGFSKTFGPGVNRHIKVDRTGNVYTVRVAGSVVGTVTYAGSAGGRLGLGSRNDAVIFDNFIVVVPGPSQPYGIG